MVLSGFNANGITLGILSFAEKALPSYLPSDIAPFVRGALQTVGILVLLGGVTIIFGGLLVWARWVRTGRLLIFLGGGAGVIGLLILLGYYAATSGAASMFQHWEYWIGIVLASVAVALAKGAGKASTVPSSIQQHPLLRT